MKKALFFLIAAAVLGSSISVSEGASPKAGAACTKAGVSQVYSNKKYTCIKSGTKTIWDKGFSLVKPAYVPLSPKSAMPTLFPTPGVQDKSNVSSQGGNNSTDNMPIALDEFSRQARDALALGLSQPVLDTTNSTNVERNVSSEFANLVAAKPLSNFTVFGPKLLELSGANSQVGVGVFDPKTTTGIYQALSALPPWSIGFTLTSGDFAGRFQVVTSNHFVPGAGEPYSTRAWRLAFKRSGESWKYQSLEGTSHPTDGKTYVDSVSLGLSGTYQIRLEFEAGTNFFGIRLPDANSRIDPLVKKDTTRVVIIGDSFTHPTLGESGPYHDWDGYPLVLDWLSAWNVIPEGVNGQGLLQPSAGETFSERIVRDVLPLRPQVVIIVASTNDYCPTCKFTSEQIGNALENDIEKLQIADPNLLIIATTSYVGNPMWASYLQSAADKRKVPFINYLNPPLIDLSQPNNPNLNGHPTRMGGVTIANGLLRAVAKFSN